MRSICNDGVDMADTPIGGPEYAGGADYWLVRDFKYSDIWTAGERGIAARRKTLNKSSQTGFARYDGCKIYQNER